MLTILFSTHGFQHFYFPFTQYNATSESQQQYTESIETRPFKLIHPSKPYLTKHPNNSKCGMDNFFKGVTVVLAHNKLTLVPKVVQPKYKPYHNKPERNCHKNHAMKLIRLFLWVAQMQTASFQMDLISLDIFSFQQH